LPADNPVYKYRMKYGSMDQCLKQPGTLSVLKIAGNNVKFNSYGSVMNAHTDQILSDAAYG